MPSSTGSQTIRDYNRSLKGLRVVARRSAFSFKGKSDDLRTIGEKLNVTTVLEGRSRPMTAGLALVVDGRLTRRRYADRDMAVLRAAEGRHVQLVGYPLCRQRR